MKKLISKEFVEHRVNSTFVSMSNYPELEIIDGNTKKIDYQDKIKFYEDDRKIICELESNGLIVKGISECHPDDEFNRLVGMTISLGRAKVKLYKKITNDYIETL